MAAFGVSARRLMTASTLFAASVVACVCAAGVVIADPQPMPDRWTQVLARW
ncbi:MULTISPECIES: hypothetical protein [Mycobacteriaceae]|uniref:hypothetical protein n=1 Tax=Mycobacteriaceae TaxID=1762 RepID=UPI000B1F3E53|nr:MULTISPECIES: hypothetical protein [Mycolicibacterium]MCX8553948.1 hypothetical protein [Mycolicibacterium mucogenicum]